MDPRPRPPHELLDDAELCDAIRTHPSDSTEAATAFEQLYLRHYDAAMVSAYRLLGDRSRAEDAVSEAFVKMLRVLQGGGGPTETFRGYLLSAVRTEALRTPAVARITDSVPVEDFESVLALEGDDPVSRFEERDQLLRAFATLRESWRRVLYLLEVEEVPTETVASRLGMGYQAVVSLAYRARDGLRSAYLQQYVVVAKASCREHAELLADFVRDTLRRRRRRTVQEHLEGCEACSEQVGRLSRINSNLKLWIGPLLGSTGLAGSLLEGSPTAAAPAMAAPGSASAGTKTWVVLGLSAAAVLGGIAILLLLRPGAEAGLQEGAAPVATAPIASEQQDGDSGDPRDSPPAGDPDASNPGNGRDVPGLRPSGDDSTPGWMLIELGE